MVSRQIRHCEKAFSASEAIFLAVITGMKDCFVVPPRNDEFSYDLSMVADPIAIGCSEVEMTALIKYYESPILP